MKIKFTLFLLLVIGLTLSFFIGSLKLWAAEQVNIGFILPLSRSSSNIGEQIKLGASIAAEEINNRGGVGSLGGAMLKLIFADSRTSARAGVKETEWLIKKMKVSVLCGAYNSFVTYFATAVAEKYRTPWVVNSSAMDEITERGFKYVFRPCNTAFYDAREQMDAIDHFSRETGRRPLTIGQLYEATEWGRNHARNIRRLCRERNYFLVLDEPYFSDKEDFSSQLSLMRKRKPDLMIVALYTKDHILFSRQHMRARVYFPFGIHSVGAGSEDPVFYRETPPEAIEYMFVQEDWPIDRIELPGVAQMLNRRFKKELGRSISAYGAQGYSNVWLIYDALERGGSRNREKIREALAKTLITKGPALITGYQIISFDKKGQNVHAHGVVSQNQKGNRVTLWPLTNRASVAEPIWPVPKWEQR
ncbi:MAG: ABC transporter substrate-binding protein [Deltaproteobacteria bacterium]|nr:ABC transporter substrate-binding protein [Deltaproteobacteria bacterium]MBW2152638.1 ABC transporter substrate-binding protein [Deltaproteobacteria bacterium]